MTTGDGRPRPARPACQPPGPRVLYITGWCRSGSTVIGNLLNELPAAVHVGEFSYLWANGVARAGTNTRCGCGADLDRCELWRQVLHRIGVTPGTAGGLALAERMMSGHAAFLRTRHVRTRIAEGTGRRRRPPELTAFLGHLADCYRAIGAVTGARVVVDSSKFPAEAAALCGQDRLDVHVLHLVRDPRASAHSWQRSKDYIPPMSVRRSSGYWTAFNGASELVGRAWPGRYLRVRYEDFAAQPASVLTDVMVWAGLDGPVPVGEDGTAVLGVNHTVTGNPDRLQRGPVRIRADDRWRRSMGPAAALTAAVLAGPLMPRYGYRLTGWRAAGAATGCPGPAPAGQSAAGPFPSSPGAGIRTGGGAGHESRARRQGGDGGGRDERARAGCRHRTRRRGGPGRDLWP